jgi:hypothetical protein
LASRLTTYGRKIFSLALIFNSLLSIIYAVGLLRGYHVEGWNLYPPFLINGAFFWVLVIASILAIFPVAKIGQVKTGRLWFHHYVYGFFVSAVSTVSLMTFTSVPLIYVFTTNTTNTIVNLGRFFFLGGLTLFLDDLPDVSKRLRRGLCYLRQQVFRGRKVIHGVQFLISVLSLYLFIAIGVYVSQTPADVTPANLILLGTTLITCLTSFWIVKCKTWLQIKAEEQKFVV